MNKAFKILEFFWLLIGCACVVMSAYFIIVKDNASALYFLGLAVVSGIMYSVRKRQRKKYEAAQNQKNN